MKNINWKVRLKNPHTIMALTAGLLLLAEQVMMVLGYELAPGLSEQIKEIVRTVLSLLALLGVVGDPTTQGLKDSKQALTYERPKERGEEADGRY